MAHIELVFLVMVAIFGAVGIVRGYARELGVTTMLLLALWVLEFVSAQFPKQLNRLLAFLVGGSVTTQVTAKALIFCGFLIIIAFISYQGVTLSFPSKGKSLVFSLGSGLLNGYLFAGSLWYYLADAGWPFIEVVTPCSSFCQLAQQILPPKILPWPYLIGLAVFMLIMRVVK